MKRALVFALTTGFLLIGASNTAIGAPRSDPNREVCATTRYDGRCEVKPNRLIAGARAVIRKIHWRSWGGRHAVGVGTLRIFPSIGAPDDELTAKARIKLGFIQTCNGRRRYQRASVTYVDDDGHRQDWYALVVRCGDL